TLLPIPMDVHAAAGRGRPGYPARGAHAAAMPRPRLRYITGHGAAALVLFQHLLPAPLFASSACAAASAPFDQALPSHVSRKPRPAALALRCSGQREVVVQRVERLAHDTSVGGGAGLMPLEWHDERAFDAEDSIRVEIGVSRGEDVCGYRRVVGR